jgi:hypothetical protein
VIRSFLIWGRKEAENDWGDKVKNALNNANP